MNQPGPEANQPGPVLKPGNTVPPPTPLPAEIPVGPKTWEIAKLSPILSDQWHQLVKSGWQVKYGDPGGGDYTEYRTKTIVVDPSEKDAGPVLVQTLAHEFGHVLYPSGDNVDSRLQSEGAATLNNIRVQREILAAGGPDITIAGADTPEVVTMFNDAYDEYAKSGYTQDAHDKAAQTIGNWYADNVHPSTCTAKTYRQYYEEGC
ncbi:hypothetical protein ACFWF7_37785 [Nocardia sp. NPDC060256]|uniref:hypothetical protein n=1 Tax=unclassified Nocardia TaxID=2637762 RepID=UPI0036566E24